MKLSELWNELMIRKDASSFMAGPAYKVRLKLMEKGWTFNCPKETAMCFNGVAVCPEIIRSPEGKATYDDRETYREFRRLSLEIARELRNGPNL